MSTISQNTKVSVAIAVAVCMAVGTGALAVGRVAGRVLTELETVIKTVEGQGQRITDLTAKVAALEESLRIYQAWPRKAEK